MIVSSYMPMPDLHRPVAAEGMRIAVIEMMRRGLTVRDVAEALRLTPMAVGQLVRGRTP